MRTRATPGGCPSRLVCLGTEAEAALNHIRARWPQWQLRSPAQAGFHIWHESGGRIEGDSKKLEGVPDSELVGEASVWRQRRTFSTAIIGRLCA
jgi:hypothetical protein